MINSYALSKARYMVDKCGTKEILINNELFAKHCNDVEIFKTLPDLATLMYEESFPKSENLASYICLVWGLLEQSIVDETFEKIQNDFMNLIPIHKDSVFSKIEFFYNSCNVNKYDDTFNIEYKKDILENSITFFEKNFKSLRNDKHYIKYQDELSVEESKSKKYWSSYDSIIGGLKNNINYKNESIGIYDKTVRKSILCGLEKIGMNFYIEYEPDFKVYPLIVDMLNDLFMLEYFFYYKKSRTRPLISASVWPDIVEEYEEGGKSYTYLFFNQLVRLEEIDPRNEKRYFLAEYTRTLNVDREDLRKLMQDIFYPIPENHRGAFGAGFVIDKIKPAPFFLEHTKMVIGGI